jgi:hypothetical protein
MVHAWYVVHGWRLCSCDHRAAAHVPADDEHSGTANVNLHVFQKQQRSDLSRVLAQMSVSGTSEPGKVAGAIAATAREAVNPKRLCVSCAGRSVAAAEPRGSRPLARSSGWRVAA